MKVINEKIKGPKHYDHAKGEYVQGKRPGLNRVYCVQVPVTSLSKKQFEDHANSKGGPRHARRILAEVHKGRSRLGRRPGTNVNIPA